MKNRHSMKLNFPNGYFIYAWLEESDDGPQISVQWRDPKNKPKHQPFYLDVESAGDIFQQLAAFSRLMSRK